MRFADLSGEPIFISFSGGRTSAYMTKWLLDRYDHSKCVVLFANTGREDPRTLDFVHKCDSELGFGTVWLEAVIHPGDGNGTTHHVVTYETATRRTVDGPSPYEEMVKKYGIPNVAFPHCTRELKLRPMHSYLRSLGHNPATIPTAIGIRADELRRVKNAANILYVLIDPEAVDKQDVLGWWSDAPFDLDIEEFEGNCGGCFKKSYAKHFAQLDKDPSVYEWTDRIEKTYAHAGAGTGPRVFFRGNLSTEQLIQLRRSVNDGIDPARLVADGGCTESCELYETESVQLSLNLKGAA
jgi:hypothetical protein